MTLYYHLLTIFKYDQCQKSKKQKQPPHNNRPKRLLLEASSYLSIGHSNVTPANFRYSNKPSFVQKLFNMTIAKKKERIQSPLVNPIINLKRLRDMVPKEGYYIAIKCHNTPGDNDSGSYEINLPYYGGGSPEEWLFWKDKLLKVVDGQSISTGPLR